MMKRILCLLLCLALLLPLVAGAVHAQETPRFFTVLIDSGNGACSERAIISGDEFYIPASSFSRYTRYRYHEDSQSFLVSGQEARHAIKQVVISPEQKALAVGGTRIELTDVFQVDGVVYLPFCQMLPILNAEILTVRDGVIWVTNNNISMAELFYGFDIQDYAYNLNAEFCDSEGLLLWYTIPSYLFDSVTNFRFDRLDIILDSGSYKDYRDIFEGYLKDDGLYQQAMEEHWDLGTIIQVVTGVNTQFGSLNNVVDWVERVEDYDGTLLAQDWLVELMQSGEKYSDYFGSYDTNVMAYAKALHTDGKGISPADFMDVAEYAYTYFNHVEDNFRMLDAVYDFSKGQDFEDTQRRGAWTVYDLYGGREWYGWLKDAANNLFERAVEESKYTGNFMLYKLTAQISGELWELVIPGNTGDISSLTLHAGIASTAMVNASSCSFNTEESTNEYRLSLLLMMLASRECYEIMADTAEGYGESGREYRNKVEKLENMIKGLYLVAGNSRLDTYEYFDDYARENRQLLQEANLFYLLEEAPEESVSAVDQRLYMDFLSQHPEYHYYSLLDVNQDGCLELLASDNDGSPHSYIDLWIWDGSFRLGWSYIWAKYEPIRYSHTNRWIVTTLGGTGGMGYGYFSIDSSLTVRKESTEWYDFCGYLYNGKEVGSDEAMMAAWNDLDERNTQDPGAVIPFFPIPGNK